MYFYLMVCFLIGYFLGSIPFGLLLTRFVGVSDLRKIGSGNIGATNVLRTGRKGIAALTLGLDLFKGFLAVIFCGLIDPMGAYIAGVASIFGHVFPLWLKFRGGKGVATGFGVILALSPLVALMGAGIWGLVAFISRYSSLGALVSFFLMPFLNLLMGRMESAVLGFFLAAVIFYTHRENILRIIQKTESKIGEPSSPSEK